jgi:hypothetical protein
MDERNWYLVTVARKHDEVVAHSWTCDIVGDNSNRAIDQALRGIEHEYKVISVALRGTKADYEKHFDLPAESD